MSYSGDGFLKKNINDGFYELKFFENGVYLVVFPPLENGKKVEAKDVIDRLTRKKVKNFNSESVETAVSKADKIPVPIAPAQEDVKIDATASVTISPDKMKAFITLTPPEGGHAVSLERLETLLETKSVTYGIDMATLEKLAKYPVYDEMLCVAEGTLPENGKDGSVQFLFDISDRVKPAILDDGRVDFRDLNIIKNVKRDQALCVLIPPTEGTPGKTVTGSVIQAKAGKPTKLPAGKNVIPTIDGQSLLAGIDGQVSYVDGKVNVLNTYEVSADVDNSTGNISFVGNVIIMGNVLSGFSVVAGGSVEVWGVVEGAFIKAEGDIVLRRGMQGLGKGKLISGGDIIARYIENSNVEAKNDIKAEAIMHSNVKCGNTLELSGRKGLLVGGTCKVGREIVAKVIGSQMATSTDIEVGLDPALREHYKAVRDEIAQIEADMKKTEQAIIILKKLESSGMLNPEKQGMLNKSIRTREFYSSRIADLKEELPLLEAKLQHDSNGKIRVYEFLYQGVKVTMGNSSVNYRETLQYCTIYRDGADIRVGAIDK